MSGFPESLPTQLYLLAYDPRKERMTARTQLGYLMRAAALTDLRLSGHVTDEGRKMRVVNPGGVADQVLGAALRGLDADPRAAALVALAAAGELRTVLPRARAREYKRRIAELTERTGPAVPAPRRVIQQARSAAAGG